MAQEFLGFFTSARGVDVFWSPLSVAVLGGIILSILLSTGRKQQGSHRDEKGLTLAEVRKLIQEELSSRPSPVGYAPPRRPSSNQGDNEGFIIVVGGILALMSVGYARNQDLVLDFSVVVATAIFGFWIATVLFSLSKGTISGRGWAIYASSVCILSLLALPILYLSLNPIYSPRGIENLQQVASEQGFAGLLGTYGADGILFLFSQVMGFIVLYGSWLYVLATLAYMAASSLVATGAPGRSLWLALTQRTSRFAEPIKATIVVCVLYSLSFIFISGLVYEWWRPGSGL